MSFLPYCTYVEELILSESSIISRLLTSGDSTTIDTDMQTIQRVLAKDELTRLFEGQTSQMNGTSTSYLSRDALFLNRFINLLEFSNRGWNETFEKFVLAFMKLAISIYPAQLISLIDIFEETRHLLQFQPDQETVGRYVQLQTNTPSSTYRIVVQQMSEHFLTQDSDVIVTIYPVGFYDKERISLKFSLKFALILAQTLLELIPDIQTIQMMNIIRVLNSEQFVRILKELLQRPTKLQSFNLCTKLTIEHSLMNVNESKPYSEPTKLQENLRDLLNKLKIE